MIVYAAVRYLVLAVDTADEQGGRREALADLTVDRFGCVLQIHPAGRRLGDLDRRERIETLVDLGLVEWRAIGREDSEPFLTCRYMEATRSARESLPVNVDPETVDVEWVEEGT